MNFLNRFTLAANHPYLQNWNGMSCILRLALSLICSAPACIFLTRFIIGFYEMEEHNWRRIFLLSTAASTLIMFLLLNFYDEP